MLLIINTKCVITKESMGTGTKNTRAWTQAASSNLTSQCRSPFGQEVGSAQRANTVLRFSCIPFNPFEPTRGPWEPSETPGSHTEGHCVEDRDNKTPKSSNLLKAGVLIELGVKKISKG